MARSNMNHVVIGGNLTSDPALRSTSAGVPLCELRIANNVSFRKDGKWTSKVNYFQATVWGVQAENCAKYLKKGSGLTVEGKLDWQKWQSADDPNKTNSRVLINATFVEFTYKKNTDSSKPSESDSSDPQDDVPF